jgi:GH35 family endo-1,4-beta-xylanase
MDELLSHLSTVIFPYLREVDVFNELTWWHNYDHPFTKLMHGDQKIKIATTYFRKFNQQNPRLLATINDFLPNHEYPHLIRQLLDNSAPIQAIGQQTHMHQGNWSHARLATILDRLGNFSKPIIFTEVSVLSAPLQPQLDYSRTYTDWYSTPQGEAQQAQYLVNFYKLLFAHPLVQGIYLWSFSDRSAWLGAPTGILDRENRPKPAYQALDQLINHQWRTSGEFQSNDQGIISIPNAFSGEYLLTNGKQQIPLGDHSPAQPLSRSITLT